MGSAAVRTRTDAMHGHERELTEWLAANPHGGPRSWPGLEANYQLQLTSVTLSFTYPNAK